MVLAVAVAALTDPTDLSTFSGHSTNLHLRATSSNTTARCSKYSIKNDSPNGFTGQDSVGALRTVTYKQGGKNHVKVAGHDPSRGTDPTDHYVDTVTKREFNFDLNFGDFGPSPEPLQPKLPPPPPPPTIMSAIERAISELRAEPDSAIMSIQTVQKGGDDSDSQAAQLSDDNSKIIPALPNGEWNQKFIVELVPDTFELTFAIVLEDGTKVYVTSKDASAGDSLLVSCEPTVYGVGADDDGLLYVPPFYLGRHLFDVV
ncbi:hypothetical protein H1R20_g1157, partial [Candolleomyces eurysporus]